MKANSVKPEIIEREFICPEERLLREMYGRVERLKEPVDVLQWRCKCGKYRHRRYGNLICERCGERLKERIVRRIPQSWRITKEYKEWLKAKKKEGRND